MPGINKISSIYMIGKAAWNVFKVATTPNPTLTTKGEAWRPPQWDAYGTDEEQMIYLAPNIAEVTEVLTGAGASQRKEEVTVGYYFDAFLKESHSGSVRVTEHPVQGGSNISDHAYNLPDRLTLDVLVSDSVESIISGQFTGGDTKSTSAYEILRSLKERRVLVSVRTRLHYYTNMIIESLNTSGDYRSSNSLRCSVVLRQVMMAVVPVEYVTLKKKQAVVETKKGPQSTEDGSALATMTGQ